MAVGQKTINLPIDINIDFRGGVQVNHRYAEGALKDYVVKELGGIENIRANLRGQTIYKDIPVNLLQQSVAKATGDYFEYCLFSEILNVLSGEGIVVGGTPPDTASARIDAAAKRLAPKIKRETEAAARTAAPGIVAGLKLSEEDMKKTIELNWLGGSGSIGDLQVKIGNKVIMIECKSYRDTTISEYGIGYFTLSDAAKNFPKMYWQFLHDIGSPYWLPPTTKGQSWRDTILNKGFEDYTQTFGKDNEEILLYLLQKGEKYRNKGYKRAIVTLERASTKENQSQVSIIMDINQIADSENLSSKYHEARVVFYNNGEEIGSFGITDKSLETIGENQVEKSPEKDGKGWTTIFNFILHKNYFNNSFIGLNS